MSDINVLINKIIKDAEDKKEEILKSAAEEEERILNKKITAAEQEKTQKLQKAKSEAVLRRDRIISSASLEVRNKKLAAKQKMIEKVFGQALVNLSVLPAETYLNFIKNSIIALDLKGDETIIISSKDKGRITDAFIADINKILSSEGKNGNLKLRDNYGSFSGGFVVVKGGIELNYTFEALLDSVKDEMENEVANILFS